jgi:hypothetical protein
MTLFNGYEEAVLNALLGSNHTILSANLTWGLSTTTPAEDGTNITEPTAPSYNRVVQTNDSTNWPLAAAYAGQKKNATVITWDEAIEAWGVVTHWVLYDNGVPAQYGALAASLDVIIGVQPQIDIEDLVFWAV